MPAAAGSLRQCGIGPVALSEVSTMQRIEVQRHEPVSHGEANVGVWIQREELPEALNVGGCVHDTVWDELRDRVLSGRCA